MAWDRIEGTVRAALAERALTPAAAQTDIQPVAASEYPRLQGAAGATPAEESRHEVVEERVERLPRRGRIEFHALHADVGETGRPLPALELMQRAAVLKLQAPPKLMARLICPRTMALCPLPLRALPPARRRISPRR